MYNYEAEKQGLFTEEGMAQVLKTKDKIAFMLEDSGAFVSSKAMGAGCAWRSLAILDYLVEQGFIKEVTGKDVMGQHRVFVKA